MTATDELRRMLDEAGVEWDADDEIMDDGSISQVTYWYSNGIEWSADGRDEYLAFDAVQLITPAQAIAATLGAGTCKPREVRSRFSKTQEYVTYHCECGHELGGYMTAELPFPRTYNEDKLPNFCPNCGRRVMDE